MKRGSSSAGKAAQAPAKRGGARKQPARLPPPETPPISADHRLVVLTGISGAGKLSAMRAFEDLGYYAVDNLPLELIPQFAELVRSSSEIRRAAIGVDVREGVIERFPPILAQVAAILPTSVLFLEASDEVLIRRYSETRRPHPLSRGERMVDALREERRRMEPIREVADIVLDTSGFNVHELRRHIQERFSDGPGGKPALLVALLSFGFKAGLPPEADLVFDVRFLPNPHFVPQFRNLTGRNSRVAGYVKQFPQTTEFLDKVTDLLNFLLPLYVQEGKSYLTVAFGCTGGQHRSVAIAEEIRKRLARAGYQTKALHRDMPRK